MGEWEIEMGIWESNQNLLQKKRELISATIVAGSSWVIYSGKKQIMYYGGVRDWNGNFENSNQNLLQRKKRAWSATIVCWFSWLN